MYVQVVFPLPFRKSFTYSVPPDFTDILVPGVRVAAPFGKRVLTGFVIDVSDTTDLDSKIKPIRDVLDLKPIFDKDTLKFYEWLAEYYLSSLGEALRNSVPQGLDVETKRKIVSDPEFCSGLLEKEKNKNSLKAKLLKALSEKETHNISCLQKQTKTKNIYSSLRNLEKLGAISILDIVEEARVRVKKKKFILLAKPADEIYEAIPEIESSSPRQVVILLELLSSKTEVQQSDLLKRTKAHQASINSLAAKGLVKTIDKEVEREYSSEYFEAVKNFELTEKQNEIISEINEKILSEEFKPYLLHGVTGSGKTQVYIELAKNALGNNKTVIILVPEISLTPQITSRFYNSLGNIVAVLHSRMSPGERYDSWRNIINGKYKVVIGPRSALFAPVQNLGLIVIDEEHDSSYKQNEQIPRYHARDTAVMRAMMSGCPVVLGSATPSIESMYNASSGKYHLLTLSDRVDNAKLPVIKLVDLVIEKKKKRMDNVFSKSLLEAIQIRLLKKESVIILQNRRGFSTQVYCEDCGHIEICGDCSVSLVHHINRNILQCHYCGFTKPVPKACSLCGSLSVKFFGTGTQRVEDELAFYFPNTKIERIDSDTMNTKGKLGEILTSFRKGEIEVLVGTQMVSKGLDFSNVTLVGVISAETTLWLPDFRADERTFQLLTQVSGRAGRSSRPGEVIIQTQNHRHFVLQKVLMNDYESFYENELKLREQGGYPPFTRLALIETKDEDESKARGAIVDFYKFLSKYKKHIDISPHNPALISKLKGQYRFHILVKSYKRKDASGRVLRNALLETYILFNQKSRYREVKLIIDIDPQAIM